MAGKPMVKASRRLGYALDKFSKNALADIVIDLVRGVVGEDAPESEVIANLQSFADAVMRQRGDKLVSLESEMAKLDRSDEAYRKRAAGYRSPEELAAEKRLAEQQAEMREQAVKIREENARRPVIN